MAVRVVAMSSLVFLLSFISFASMATAERCDYFIKVKTGDVDHAGTDSKISLMLISSSGTSLTIDDLAAEWGVKKGTGIDNFFEQGAIDDFKGRDTCIKPCAITVFSNGQFLGSGWYLEYVDVALRGPSIDTQIQLTVNQWLDTDESPNVLYAHVNKCPRSN